jgi:phage baseplate assembly protein W
MDRRTVMAQRAITLPFSFDASGGVSYAVDEQKIWQDRVAIVVMTKLRERVMRPTFGSSVPNVVFENLSTGFTLAKQSIESTFTTWLPQLKLVSVTGEVDDNANALIIQITFKYREEDETTVRLKTAILNRAGETILEVTNG